MLYFTFFLPCLTQYEDSFLIRSMTPLLCMIIIFTDRSKITVLIFLLQIDLN